jgi:hypothetical protein
MKKKITFIALLTVLSLNAFAQDYQKSIGARLGSNIGVTYKQFISPSNAFEIIGNALFFDGGTYLGVSGEYLWSWGLADGLSWFVGPGASVGVWTGGGYSGFNIALNGMIGLEYKFDNIPLALSADHNPHFYLLNGVGISPFVGALSVRYTF